MRLFRNRPLCLCCAVYIAASALGFLVNGTVKLILMALAVASLLTILILALYGKRSRLRVAVAGFVCLFALSAFAGSYLYFDRGEDRSAKYKDEPCFVKATVIEARNYESYYSVYGIEVNEINGEKVNLKALLECEYEADLQAGYEIMAVLAGADLSELYGRDLTKTLMSDGYRLLFVDDPALEDESGNRITYTKVISKDGGGLSLLSKRANTFLSTRLTMRLGNNAGRLSGALLLGNRDKISDEGIRDFKRAGVSHLLALSGLHMSIILGIFGFLLGLMRIGRGPKLVILGVFALCYLMLTGCSVSSMRSFFMVSVAYFSMLIGGKADTPTSLFLAGALILVIHPYAVCDAAYWLSLFATLGIVLGNEVMAETNAGFRDIAVKHKVLKAPLYLLSALVTCLLANIAVTLFMWLYFGELALASPITTLVLTPIVYLLIIISLAVLLLGAIPGVAPALSAVASWLTDIVYGVTSSVSGLDRATVSLHNDIIGAVIIAVSIALMIMLMLNVRKKALFLIPAGILAVSLGVASFAGFGGGEETVTYLRASSRGEMLVMTSENKAVILDISDGSYSHLNNAADEVRDRGMTVTHAIVLTHYHSKHVTSLLKYIGNNIVKEIWLPHPFTDKEKKIMTDMISRLDGTDVRIVFYNGDGTKAIELSPTLSINLDREYLSRSAQPVIYADVVAGDMSLTYVGSSLAETTLYGKYSDLVRNRDHVIFGNHGPIPKKIYKFPVDENKNKTVVFATEVVLSYAAIEDTAFREALSKVCVVLSPERISFEP